MADPLSVAASVAGLIALGGSVAKKFYQFFHSIADAPRSVRELASSLFSLNVALCQVQELLLHPDFLCQAGDQDIASLGQCLERCTELFSNIESEVARSDLAGHGQNVAKKAWESVKWSFNEDDITSRLQNILHKKSTLTVMLEAFTAKMTAGIMGRVQLLQAEAQKQGRMLKDIHVFCKWQYARETGHNSSNAGPPLPATTYSGFSASQAYDEGDLPRLIQSRSSVLSLQIGDLFDDSVSVTWTPDTSSKAPPRRMQSVFCTSQPSFDELGGMQSPPLELQGSEGSLELISKIYSIDQQSSERKLRRRAMAMATAFERGARYSPSIFAAPYSMMASLLRVVEGANDAIAGDLKMMRSKICLIEASTKDIEPSGILDRAALEVYENVTEYGKFAEKYFGDRLSERVTKHLAGIGEETRQQLRSNFDTALDSFITQYDVLVTSYLVQLQKETLEIQKEQTQQQRLLMAKMNVLVPNIHL